ncbi:MAG: isoprenyl transferase [Clostridia bacterium]|nr:isoprenyl transferase [Clostridia bacterium]
MEEQKIPRHIAIIMDGNRRWAKKRNLPTKLGHKQGAETLKKLARYANKIGLEYLTVYAFSTENWKRTEEEVNSLMSLLQNYLEDFAKEADTENIVIRVLGDRKPLSDKLNEKIDEAIERTKNNTGTIFNIALNYGGRDEIVHAAKRIAERVKDGEINIDDINEELVSQNLYTREIPDPDLLIRTSGEIRLSGFLPWQTIYSEFYFIDKLWPDFTSDDLDEAIKVYNGRKINKGK